MKAVHVLATSAMFSCCHLTVTCVGATPVPPRTAYPPQATGSGVACATCLPNKVPLDPRCSRPAIVTGDQMGRHTQHDEPGPKGFTPTTSQPVAQEPDGGNTLVESPSVESQIVTSVITSTVIVLPTPLPAFGSESTKPGGNGTQQGGAPPNGGRGLSPPPALIQWGQCVLVGSELAWMLTTLVRSFSWSEKWKQWKARCRLLGRKAGDKKLANDEPDTQAEGEKSSGDTSRNSGNKDGSNIVSPPENGSGHERFKDFFGLLSKLIQYTGAKGPCPNPPCN